MIKSLRSPGALVVAVVVAASAALALITTAGAAAAHSRPARVAQTASSGTTVSTRTNKLGTFLVGPNGHTLYLWEKDSKNKSACSGECQGVWPPLRPSGKLIGTNGVKSSELGTITVSGGKQVTYDGHPLYYYQEDTKPGETTGEGSGSFGAPWYVVSTSGKAIK